MPDDFDLLPTDDSPRVTHVDPKYERRAMLAHDNRNPKGTNAFSYLVLFGLFVFLGLGYTMHVGLLNSKPAEELIPVDESALRAKQAADEEARRRQAEDTRRLEMEHAEENRKKAAIAAELKRLNTELDSLVLREGELSRVIGRANGAIATIKKAQSERVKVFNDLTMERNNADKAHSKAEGAYLDAQSRLQFAQKASAEAHGTHVINKTAKQLRDAQNNYDFAKQNYENAKAWHEAAELKIKTLQEKSDQGKPTLEAQQRTAQDGEAEITNVRARIEYLREKIEELKAEAEPSKAVPPPPPPPEEYPSR